MSTTARRTLLLSLAVLGTGAWLLADRSRPTPPADTPKLTTPDPQTVAIRPVEPSPNGEVTPLVIKIGSDRRRLSEAQIRQLIDSLPKHPQQQGSFGGGFGGNRSVSKPFGGGFGTGGSRPASGFGAGGAVISPSRNQLDARGGMGGGVRGGDGRGGR